MRFLHSLVARTVSLVQQFLNAIVSLSERSSLSQKSVKKRKLFAICDCDRKNFDNMCSKHAARSISSQNLDCLSIVSVHKEVL
ncbi:hypothetical protein C7B80_18215 [Cyanosarcina cf. burmensis CCALA 770]|nr:hypothetical protein C7B80_18215 [Cyanosarcina cf. burmensis CCALA 770]